MNLRIRHTIEQFRWGVKSLRPRRLKARFGGPRVLVNSVPKSGTNLLTRCLSLFPMLRPSFEHVEMNQNRSSGNKEFRRKVETTKPGQYTSGHVFQTIENQTVVEERDVEMLLMVRDPRDVVTSHAHYVTEINTDHRLNEHYRNLPTDGERLLASIRGVPGEKTADGDRLEGIGEWLDSFLRWDEEPFTQMVKFEDLIGPRGGGTCDAQRDAIRSMAEHLSVSLTKDEVTYVAENTFSTSSSTYRKGLIGDWKNHYTSDHVDAFKEETGNWLVELGYESDPDWRTSDDGD